MKSFFLCLIILFFTIDFLNAGSPISIFYGANLEGKISSKGEIDTFTFYGLDQEHILIRMRDETDVDAHLKLFDPNGQLIAEDWSDGGLAELKELVLDVNGYYQLIAFDHNHNDLGDYGLSLHSLNALEYALPINNVASFQDEITKNCELKMYSFHGEEGDLIYAELRAATVHFEGEFHIYNSLGEQTFKSTKNGQREFLGPVIIDETDEYTIAILDRGGNDKDSFGFTLNTLNRHELVNELNCGENMFGSLNGLVDRKLYRVSSALGTTQIIETRSNDLNLELTMEIYDESGTMVFQETNTNHRSHACLNQLDYESSYLVVIYDKNGNDTGDYGIQFHNIEDASCLELMSCGNYSSPITISNLAGSNACFIQGISSMPINISLSASNELADPELRLYDQFGHLLFEDSADDVVGLSEYEFPSDDIFILLASDNTGNEIGDFVLNVELSSLDLDLNECHMVYDGFEPFETTLLSVDSEQMFLEYEWSSGETSSSISVSPSEDTEYFVTVTNSFGCSEILATMVEVQNVSCGNGNNNKVKVCHVKNDGSTSQKCLSENGVWGHIENGLGHEECYLGTCNYESICLDELGIDSQENLQFGDKINFETREKNNQSIVSSIYPNPSSNTFVIDLEIDHQINQINILDIQGKLVKTIYPDGSDNLLVVSMSDFNVAFGLYYAQLISHSTFEVHKLLYLE